MDKVKYWIDLADYDLDTARDMLRSRRWIYVAFMCHQTLEKTIKAYYTQMLPDDPPYIHNLTRLAEKSGLSDLMTDEQKSFIDAVTPMNIAARYPDYKSMLATSLNQSVCEDLIQRTEQMQQWIKSKL